jgi:hypothetical protein
MNTASLPMLWSNCVERLKDRINQRSFWEAVEQARPITIENDTLVIGLESGNYNLASHLQQAAHWNAILQTVSAVFGQPLHVRLIEGTTLADWDATKARDARVAEMKQTAATRQQAEFLQIEGWESVLEQIARLYSQMPYRTMPQGKARFANEALYMVVEAMDTLYPDDADEAAERSLARTLDRIAHSSEIPAPVLAFELERLRAWRRASAETEP